MNEESRSVATAVFTRGPGDSIMLSEKIPTTARNSHWPSYSVHLWFCRDRRVSAGEKEVFKAVIEEAGEVRFRSFDLSLRRSLWGTSSCKDFHGIWICSFFSPSFQDGRVACIAPCDGGGRYAGTRDTGG